MVNLSSNNSNNINLSGQTQRNVNISTPNTNNVDANTMGNSQRARSWAIGEGLIDGEDYSAKHYALLSQEIEQQIASDTNYAHIWAEGTDEQVEALGGEHSSKGWVDYVLTNPPTASIEQTETGATITIHDINGTTTADITNGTDGADGQDGADGSDGFSPIATVTKSGSTATISITDANGTTTTTVTDGQNGTDGQDGADGQDGSDGFSPIATVSKSGDTATISITDVNGTTTTTITDGTNGQNGQDGAAATIAVGTVTTGSAGSSASVTNSGTSSAAVFDFTIPRGDKGETGSTGATGNGVLNTQYISSSGLVDTYHINYTNGNYDSFTVTNGANGTGSVADVWVNGASVLDGDIAKIELPDVSDMATQTWVTNQGYTTNMGTVTSVNNVQPVNGNVSLTIPTVNDATLTIQKNGTTVGTFTANDTNNVTADISVPTSISDLTDDTATYPIDKADTLTGLTASVSELNYVNGVTSAIQTQIDNKADTTLSNVSSIDSNSAVQTALDGKVDLDYSNADYQPVNKAGDTMTGNLEIAIPNGYYTLKDTEFDSTTTTSPSNWRILGTIAFLDENNAYTGFVQNSFTTNNIVQLGIGARRIINGDNKTAQFIAQVNSSGVASCSFPGTTCVDGQWVSKSVTIMNSQSLNGSTVLTYTLTDVPNDGYKYEVLLTGQLTTGSTSGNSVRLEVDSDAVTDVVICAAQTRTSSTMPGRGAVVLPLTASRKIHVLRSTSFNGTGTLYLRGYRRIGTNS